ALLHTRGAEPPSALVAGGGFCRGATRAAHRARLAAGYAGRQVALGAYDPARPADDGRAAAVVAWGPRVAVLASGPAEGQARIAYLGSAAALATQALACHRPLCAGALACVAALRRDVFD